MLTRAFKNMVAVSMETDWTFKEAEKIKTAAKNAPVAVAAPAGGAAAAEKPAEKEEEPEEEVDMGGLFGDDGDY